MSSGSDLDDVPIGAEYHAPRPEPSGDLPELPKWRRRIGGVGKFPRRSQIAAEFQSYGNVKTHGKPHGLRGSRVQHEP